MRALLDSVGAKYKSGYDTYVYARALKRGLEEPKNIYGLYPHDFSYTHVMVDEVHEWHQAGVFEARKKRGFGSAPVGLVGVRMFHGDEAFAPSAHGDPAHRFVSRMTM